MIFLIKDKNNNGPNKKEKTMSQIRKTFMRIYRKIVYEENALDILEFAKNVINYCNDLYAKVAKDEGIHLHYSVLYLYIYKCRRR